MALQNAILAALAHGESSGYDLAKAFDVTVANYWTATPQQLYRELEKMEVADLIVARVVEQERRPNKKVFSLSDAGQSALREFTSRTPKPIAIRDELLVQVEGMDVGDAQSVRNNIQDKLAAAELKLKRYEKMREFLLEGRTEAAYIAEAKRLGSYFTLARGIAFEHENIRWCEFVLKVLSDRK